MTTLRAFLRCSAALLALSGSGLATPAGATMAPWSAPLEGGTRLTPTTQVVQAGGVVASGIGDINGDGLRDVAYTFLRPSGRYEAWIPLDGRPFSTLRHAADAPKKMLRIVGPAGSGLRLANAGDWNADRREEVVVGAPGAFDGRGAIFVISGRRAGGVVDLDGNPPQVTRIALTNGQAGDNLGAQVAGGANVVGDAGPDIVTSLGTAVALVIPGSPSLGAEVAIAPGDENVSAVRVADGPTSAVTLGTDMDGDRRPDIAIGQASAAGRGIVTIVFGGLLPPTLDAREPSQAASTLLPPASIIYDPSRDAGPEFGSTLAGSHGRSAPSELVVGSPGYDDGHGAVFVVPRVQRATSARVSSPLATGPDGRPGPGVAPGTPLFRGSRLSSALTVGDFDGDGRDTIVAGLERKTAPAPAFFLVDPRGKRSVVKLAGLSSEDADTFAAFDAHGAAPGGIALASPSRPLGTVAAMPPATVTKARRTRTETRLAIVCHRLVATCRGRIALNGPQASATFRIPAGSTRTVVIKRRSRPTIAYRLTTRVGATRTITTKGAVRGSS